MMSILTLALMVLLVATMRPAGRSRPKRPGKSGDTLTLGRGVKVGKPSRDPKNPGVVTYELMQDKKLPSRSKRVMRRLMRPFSATSSWVRRGFRSAKTDSSKAETRSTSAQSVELQNFLDARNREIARRKSEGDKPGPGDTLH